MQKTTVEGFRLSPQQKHLWSLQQDEGGMTARATCSVLIEGALDFQALERAVEMAVGRNEILRTSFVRLQGMAAPLQVVRDGGPVRIERLEACDLESQDRSPVPDRPPRADLDDATGLHLSLLSTSPDEHTLHVSLPALCADAVGLKNFVSELGRCYAASVRGEEVADEPMQYADFSDWQHEILASEETEVGRAYWRQAGGAGGHHPALPLENAPAAEHRFSPEVFSRALDAATAARLEGLACAHGSSLSSVALAAYFTLLSRLTASSQLRLGVSFEGRSYEELTSALGLFARFLPVNAGLPGETPFPLLLSSLDASLADAARWQELFTPDAAGLPPYCFEYAGGGAAVEAGPLRFTLERAAAYVSRFRLLLRCERRGDGPLLAEWHFDCALYGESEVARLAERWTAVIESLMARSFAARLDEVGVVCKGERAELMRYSRGARIEWEEAGCLHEIFERQAQRTPDAMAVVSEEGSLTYRELEERSNRLARRLRSLGVGAESRVGLMLERSVGMVVGLLGILKAGGAYVPLEAGQPVERLSRMAGDAGVRALVTTDSLRAQAQALGVETEIYLDGDRERIERESCETLGATAVGDNAAYVIYTSGSTGSPKGVVISHRSIRNRLLWMSEQFPLTAGDCVLQKTPYNFDASIWEFFAPLFAGARLVMARPGGHQDGAYLVAAIVEHGVTTLQLVPSMLRVLLEEPGFDRCKSLRRVFCGGEALTAKIQEQFFARMSLEELHNLYGPTETAIDATSWTFRADDRRRAVIIGQPIANTEVHILDAHLRPVPFGVGGELHIGGVNLARGYLNRPGLTAERFIPNPFGEGPGERLYKTGDLVRRLEDGSIEYLGRIDHQIKLRGFRIEPGEIEAALCRHPQVRQAVVTLREGEAGHKRLVAYVVGPSDTALTAGELQGHLKSLLPEYMVPSGVVLLDSLPLTPNGKDRKSTRLNS